MSSATTSVALEGASKTAAAAATSPPPLEAADWKSLSQCEERCQKLKVTAAVERVLVNATSQRLHLFRGREWRCTFPVSTAEKGVGQIAGSFQTPLGLHQVSERIGDGCDEYDVFVSRVKTGAKCAPTDKPSHIVGRILRLVGLEEGHNKGRNKAGELVDSWERYIYIHGTNHIAQIGKPASIGCVRMKPADVVRLYSQVPVKSVVYIYKA